jgi:hypothetical protein
MYNAPEHWHHCSAPLRGIRARIDLQVLYQSLSHGAERNGEKIEKEIAYVPWAFHLFPAPFRSVLQWRITPQNTGIRSPVHLSPFRSVLQWRITPQNTGIRSPVHLFPFRSVLQWWITPQNTGRLYISSFPVLLRATGMDIAPEHWPIIVITVPLCSAERGKNRCSSAVPIIVAQSGAERGKNR